MHEVFEIQRLVVEGRLEEARERLRPLTRSHPPDAGANMLMSVVHAGLGEPEAALYSARRALEGRPTDAAVLVNIGNALSRLGAAGESIEVYERAVAAQPRWDEPRCALVTGLLLADRLSACVDRCRGELEAFPEHPRLTAALGGALLRAGRPREAAEVLERGARRWPDDHTLATSWCSAGHYCGDRTWREHLEAARHYSGMMLGRLGPPRGVPAREGASRLRVGLLSADLKRHAVAWFVRPLLEHADRGEVELLVYSTAGNEDATSDVLRGLADGWAKVMGLDMRALAQRIRGDGVDVLVDLSGHTAGHRLGTIATGAAATQVGYFGFPNTTGCPGLGWRLVDAVTDPEGTESWSTERLLRLPRPHLCYGAPDGVDAREEARAGDGPIVFGSFSAASKFDPLTIGMWAGVLKATPGSVLRLRHSAMADAGVRANLWARFERHGVEPGRVRIEPPSGRAADLMAEYRGVDVALDTFPYNGVTTTCEALWMGVPVVSRAGPVAEGWMGPSRVGEAVLGAAGLKELVATGEEGFVEIAAGLAQDRARLSALRRGLGDRFRASPVCDGAGFASAFVAALRRAWETDRAGALAEGPSGA
ncbi:MAG: tetratricopeptide repeat protein [Phycisphaerae bacterium]|nr:tetratricopeptide repeat protein [Phycisphaerae bacterium]